MKIIFSPSKDMTFEKIKNKDWNLNEHSQSIINKLKTYSNSELKDKLKINDSILETVKEYIDKFDNEVTYPAIYMYNGLSFRTMDTESLDNDAIDYLNNNLLLLSALYGPIPPNKLIKPYRLDFLSKIKIYGNSLKNFWIEKYNSSFDEKETIINLASNEFSDLLDKYRYNWIDFEFYENKDGKIKSHSTYSKKGRGLLLRYMAKNKISKIEEIKNFNLENYSISEDSTDNNFIFIKDK